MCLIIFGYQTVPGHHLILAANRDEFQARPAAPAQFWQDCPDVFGGRDLEAGGSWLAIARTGRMAFVTNLFGVQTKDTANRLSRGELVANFVKDANLSPSDYLEQVSDRAQLYDGFNLVVMTDVELWFYSNADREAPRRLDPGWYGFSNSILNEPWPKVERSLTALRQAEVDEDLYEIMRDETTFEGDIPGPGLPIYLKSGEYRTRCTSLVRWEHSGEVCFQEVTYDNEGRPAPALVESLTLG